MARKQKVIDDSADWLENTYPDTKSELEAKL